MLAAEVDRREDLDVEEVGQVFLQEAFATVDSFIHVSLWSCLAFVKGQERVCWFRWTHLHVEFEYFLW